MSIGDVNVDGWPDVAVTNFYSNTVSVIFGNGDGTFGAKADYATGPGPQSAVIVDLYGSGSPNVVFAEQGTHSVGVLAWSDGLGAAGGYGDFTGPISVAIADLDADGDLDVAVANAFGGSVSIRPGIWWGASYRTADNPYSVAIGDLNADGRPDLAVACNSGSAVSVLLGNGDRTFADRTDLFPGIQCTSVGIADFNADGRQDLAVVNYRSNTVSVLLGDGNGGFPTQLDFPTGSFPLRLAIGDLNLDGRPDLAVANSGSNTVSAFLGNGDGTFAPRIDFGTGDVPVAVAIADLNADCRPDLVVANWRSDGVSVLMNTGPLPQVSVAFEFTPGALNLANQGLWVTGYLEPAPPLTAADIDVASIRVNGTVSVDPAASTALGDYDGDGVTDLMVKFNRLAVELTLSEGDSVPVTVTGTAPCRTLIGTDYIRVRRVPVSAPSAGSHLTAGSVAEVRWQTPGGVTVESVALLQSFDGGATWSQIARGLPNTGSYAWTVPSVQSDQANVAVVLVESADATGELVDGVLGLSETFSIETVVGVGGGPVKLALSVRGPDRGMAGDGHVRVEFALRDATPARLELADVAGRVLASRQVGTLGPGSHTLDLSPDGGLRSGIYFLRLTQGGDEVRARAAVLR